MTEINGICMLCDDCVFQEMEARERSEMESVCTRWKTLEAGRQNWVRAYDHRIHQNRVLEKQTALANQF